jgi:RNA polymerase sigma factor (sigma-70 family)
MATWRNIQLKTLSRADFVRHFTKYKLWQNSDNPSNLLIREGTKSKDILIRSNLGLCFKPARKYSKGNEELFDDLVSEAVFGLNRALEKFDLDQNIEFSTYAYGWIISKMTRYLNDKEPAIYLPSPVRRTWIKCTEVIKEFEKAHNRQPSAEEISKILNIKPKKYATLRAAACTANTVSLNTPARLDEGNVELLDQVADSWEKAYSNYDALVECKHLLNNLTTKEQRVLDLLFGLTEESHTLKEAADKMSISNTTLTKIRNKALTKLKDVAVAA